MKPAARAIAVVLVSAPLVGSAAPGPPTAAPAPYGVRVQDPGP